MKGILKRWIALSLTFMLMCAAIPVRAQENEMDMQAETQTMESEIEQRINFVYIEIGRASCRERVCLYV